MILWQIDILKDERVPEIEEIYRNPLTLNSVKRVDEIIKNSGFYDTLTMHTEKHRHIEQSTFDRLQKLSLQLRDDLKLSSRQTDISVSETIKTLKDKIMNDTFEATNADFLQILVNFEEYKDTIACIFLYNIERSEVLTNEKNTEIKTLIADKKAFKKEYLAAKATSRRLDNENQELAEEIHVSSQNLRVARSETYSFRRINGALMKGYKKLQRMVSPNFLRQSAANREVLASLQRYSLENEALEARHPELLREEASNSDDSDAMDDEEDALREDEYSSTQGIANLRM